MKRILLLLLIPAAAAMAQKADTPAIVDTNPQHVSTRVFVPKYADVGALYNVLRVFGGGISIDQNLHAIAVQGDKEKLDAIALAIKQLDVPPTPTRDVELTFHLIMAVMQEGAGPTLPHELDPVIKQLRGLFPYKDYKLLETTLLRTRPGESAQSSGLLPMLPPDGPKGTYRIQIQRVTATSEEKDTVVQLNHLAVNFKIPVHSSGNNFTFYDAGLSTDLDIHENQKVVVGKANVDGSQDALVMVVTAKMVN